MEFIQVPGHRASIKNDFQIMGMGGPYLGDLFLDDTLISGDCLSDNLIYCSETGELIFVKWHPVSRWQVKNYFTINFLDLTSKIITQSTTTFKMVFVKSVTAKEVEIYHAFHDKIESTREVLSRKWV
jgi:hypothetical protein